MRPDLESLVNEVADELASALRHYGPGAHPGTGTEQEVHAGGNGRPIQVTAAVSARAEANLKPYVIADAKDLWGANSTFYVAPSGAVYSGGTHAETTGLADIPREDWPTDERGQAVGLEGGLIALGWARGYFDAGLNELGAELPSGPSEAIADKLRAFAHRLGAELVWESPQKVEKEWSGLFRARHYGPGEHPGTGSPQEVHAGGQVADYPLAEEFVSDLRVLSETPNRASIAASLDDWTELPGIREIPMAIFEGITGQSYSKSDNDRIAALVEAIRQSGEIKPLIVVMDADGPYILEGSHRIDALHRLGVATFPALVVLDHGATRRHYGPGAHPGTGTEQQVHAGGDGRQKDYGSPEWKARRQDYEKRLAEQYGMAEPGTVQATSIAWIGPRGWLIAPEGDHQESAMWLTGKADVDLTTQEGMRQSVLATDEVVNSGLIRVNAGEPGGVAFDLPGDEDAVTDEQWTAMAALLTQAAAEHAEVPPLTITFGGPFGRQLPLGEPGARLPPRFDVLDDKAYELLDLDRDFLRAVAAGEFGREAVLPAAVRGLLRRLHYGPGTHPGTGTEQQVHAGDGGRPKRYPESVAAVFGVDRLNAWERRANQTVADWASDLSGNVKVIPRGADDPFLGMEDYWILANGDAINVTSHDATGEKFTYRLRDAGLLPEGTPPGNLSGEATLLALGLVRFSTSGQRGITVGDRKLTDAQAETILRMARGNPEGILWETVKPYALPSSEGLGAFIGSSHGQGDVGLASLLEVRHYGPGDHPGTGTPQQAHAGADGRESKVIAGERQKGGQFPSNTNINAAAKARRYLAERIDHHLGRPVTIGRGVVDEFYDHVRQKAPSGLWVKDDEGHGLLVVAADGGAYGWESRVLALGGLFAFEPGTPVYQRSEEGHPIAMEGAGGKGSGLGTAFMQALKDYVDASDKKLIIHTVANPRFFERFDWLRREDPESTLSYRYQSVGYTLSTGSE